MKKIILAGNAITAEIIYDYLAEDKRYQVIGMTVDDAFVENGTLKGVDSIPISQLQRMINPNNCLIIMAMGYQDINRPRESLFLRLKGMGYAIESYIHPDAKVFTKLPLGEGCVILPAVVIEPHVSLGANCMVWANVTLAHHSQIEDNCWVASGAVISGKARIGQNCFIGVNATIVNDISVGDYTIIGAGALITKNIKPNSVYLARSGEELRYSSQDYIKYFGV